MTQSAGDAHGSQSPAGEESFEAHNGVELQQKQCGRRVLEVYSSGTERGDYRSRQCIQIHFKAEVQSGIRADSTPHTAEPRAFDSAVQLEFSAPEVLVTERVEPECIAALAECRDRLRANPVVERPRICLGGR